MNDEMSSWMTSVANSVTPCAVYSISYGIQESSVYPSYATVFNTQAIKLGIMGSTVVVSSGDDGAAGVMARCAGTWDRRL